VIIITHSRPWLSSSADADTTSAGRDCRVGRFKTWPRLFIITHKATEVPAGENQLVMTPSAGGSPLKSEKIPASGAIESLAKTQSCKLDAWGCTGQAAVTVMAVRAANRCWALGTADALGSASA